MNVNLKFVTPLSTHRIAGKQCLHNKDFLKIRSFFDWYAWLSFNAFCVTLFTILLSVGALKLNKRKRHFNSQHFGKKFSTQLNRLKTSKVWFPWLFFLNNKTKV